ncbi:MAG: neutral zinc metallopeptidase [Ignavibacteriaceae bacterium]|nr:neutral zinc metallopeptidase [Ignavibacteriaceae bacterium]
MPKVIAGFVIGITVIVLVVMLLGVNPVSLFKDTQSNDKLSSTELTEIAHNRELRHLISTVVSETGDFWNIIFHNSEITFRRPELVLYNDKIDPTCERIDSVAGPFYCPDDETIYMDLSFHDELHKQVDASCHFALIYVIAHEFGHHIQKLTGVNDKLQSPRSKFDKKEYDQYSLRLELQADFYAGVWARYSHRLNLLEESDIRAALDDASEAGYELIKKSAHLGYLVPDSFTHGTAEQRIKWFYKGFTTGDYKQGDTFSTDEL